MKKSIIAASAASLALAAMPIVNTFAAEKTVTDNITLNVNSTCAMTRTGANGTADTGVVAGAWTAGDPETTSSGTYEATIDAGGYANLGTSTISVTCNDANNGHYLTVRATGLTSNTTGATGSPINYSTTTAAAGTSSWNIVIGRPTDTTIPAWNNNALTADNIASISQTSNVGSVDLYGSSSSTNKTVLNAATFTATYNVGTAITQPAGTYTGSAVYTLTHGA